VTFLEVVVGHLRASPTSSYLATYYNAGRGKIREGVITSNEQIDESEACKSAITRMYKIIFDLFSRLCS